MYMLDTDTCSYIIKKRPAAVEDKFKRIDPLDICISVITEAELLYGLAKAPDRKKFAHLVHAFISKAVVMDWTSKEAEVYANLRAKLEAKGKGIGNMDTLIAAHALSLQATVVTNNTKHYAAVPQLKVTNWI
jgi:tRNA(fMet)-specific endonuclease VapC